MKSYFLIVAFIGFVCSLPVEHTVQNPTHTQVNITQGDMILTPEQEASLYKNPKVRNGVRNPLQMWYGGIVYYQFTSAFSKFNFF